MKEQCGITKIPKKSEKSWCVKAQFLKFLYDIRGHFCD